MMSMLQKQMHQELNQRTQISEEEVAEAWGRDLGLFRKDILDFSEKLRQLWIKKLV
jgi:hypothetical protein